MRACVSRSVGKVVDGIRTPIEAFYGPGNWHVNDDPDILQRGRTIVSAHDKLDWQMCRHGVRERSAAHPILTQSLSRSGDVFGRDDRRVRAVRGFPVRARIGNRLQSSGATAFLVRSTELHAVYVLAGVAT